LGVKFDTQLTTIHWHDFAKADRGPGPRASVISD
jgi:hypothetical protein